MSFQELAITVRVINLASAEFERISADASRMAAAVSDMNRAAVESAKAGAAFSQVAVQAEAMNNSVQQASVGFSALQDEAEASAISLRSAASAFGSVARMGSGIVALAGELGLVDKETAKWARTMFYAFTVVGSIVHMIHYMTLLTTGHSAAITVNTAAQHANATSSLALAAAHKVKAAATWMAVSAQNALNISHATFLALTGVGIGVVIAAAAAMAYFASQMNAATESLREYNEAASEMAYTSGKKIIRAGEVELLRRGVEP